jgi:hypothetical protein
MMSSRRRIPTAGTRGRRRLEGRRKARRGCRVGAREQHGLSETAHEASDEANRDRDATDFLIELRYPGGRSHLTTLASTQNLGVGSEFTLYGRNWRIVEPSVQQRRSSFKAPTRLLCIPNERQGLLRSGADRLG